MAKALGIDFGESKVGIAVSSGVLAAPLKIIKNSGLKKLIFDIKNIVEEEGIEALVVGVSENKSGQSARDFGDKLAKELNLPVYFVDETLTTKDVQRLVIEAGMKRKKRKSMEDAFAATLILQSYLDSQ
ncbi:hypothetical protein A2803_04375 [Candidatus Woesebacteria bacterium RIFCSPHIGHO2_01_FULL_44_21]|uniref:Putative pre-16S rRNA nuclease n=1 Tax=Candidatus Woesebacteria bacterium RIFCSPHIGHO2_01_FULL_44_21 TaxID=1802503 RepID=A0A1F7Z174_9BACT|nr:MAG: hypothetical protein A2803_04375 [Candidatus Woesebacteria bacterium RIFCSPHIGHO2_01_FULL_44_21]OGM71503.1 MAG: hypothetical protein A2897_04260 [Candidatus Woesebacteria bacterium RIFCSPLOWO2_01_FULL_44_24b]